MKRLALALCICGQAVRRGFIRMSREPGTVILDARSRQKFDELHVKGAINLSFPDIAVESLASTLPDRNTRILIYFARASLNLSTYIALDSYGYRNVYELQFE